MDSPNRLDPIAVTPTMARQTPKNDFGDVLANTAGAVTQVGGALASGMLHGMPVVSAAVVGIQKMTSVVSGISPVSGGTTAAGGAGAAGGVPGAARTTGKPSDLESIPLDEFKKENMQYLQLQMQMQQESREYNTITNVLKVRHDSAKAAINNVR